LKTLVSGGESHLLYLCSSIFNRHWAKKNRHRIEISFGMSFTPDEFVELDLILANLAEKLSPRWVGHRCQIGEGVISVEHTPETKGNMWTPGGARFELSTVPISLHLRSSKGGCYFITPSIALTLLREFLDLLLTSTFIQEAKKKVREPLESSTSLWLAKHYYYAGTHKSLQQPESEEARSCLERLNKLPPIHANGTIELQHEGKNYIVRFMSDAYGFLHASEQVSLPPLTFSWRPQLEGIVVRLRRSDESRLPILTLALEAGSSKLTADDEKTVKKK
jgi:hypothetical protein